MRKVYN